MTVSVERVGRRSYFVGDTYAGRDLLRDSGAHWDADRRAWWIGSAQAADALLAKLNERLRVARATDRVSAAISEDTRLLGSVTYRGRAHYALWEGETSRGHAVKLASTDGRSIAWADAADVVWRKRYAPRTYRGRTEYTTFGSMQRFKERVAEARAQGHDDGVVNGQRYECPWLAQPYPLKLVLLGNEYFDAAQLELRARLAAAELAGGSTVLFVSHERAARLRGALPVRDLFVVGLGNAEAAEFGAGLVWLKGVLAANLLRAACADRVAS